MAAKKKGRQTPTAGRVIPYKKTYGPEAVKLYNKTKRKAIKWQTLLINDIMGQDKSGLWVHTKFGYEVSRRNGKNEVVVMREMWALVNGERTLHTAHRTSTSHAAWERLGTLMAEAGYKEDEDFKTYKQLGFESVIMMKTGGIVNFRTRSSKSGLGEGYDLVVIDEAQEYTEDQQTALKYVVSASKNPQTIFCGTPPTTQSAGTVFMEMRPKVLAGEMANAGWAEWSVEDETDPKDKDAWYETNPSLGTILTERAIIDEIGEDPIDFNIQRLGLWLKYSQKSAISQKQWEALGLPQLPELQGRLFVGVKYGKDNANVAMAIAVRTKDGNIFVEDIDCLETRKGNAWILDFLSRADVAKVVIDGAGDQQRLADEMKETRLQTPILPKVNEVILANSMFTQAVEEEQIRHCGQPSLTQAVGNCEKRSIGTNGGYGYKSLQPDIEISLMDAAILAYWACATTKPEKRKQRISY